MGLFSYISKTRELGANIISVEKLANEISSGLENLCNVLDTSNGVVGYYERQSIANLEAKIVDFNVVCENLGSDFAITTIKLNGNKLPLTMFFVMMFGLINDIENSTGRKFNIPR